jgi:Uma2 family endonuclease
VPELVVEVVSPNDLAESLVVKVKEYLDGGVQMVWVVYPIPGWIHVYESLHRVRGLTVADDLDGGTVLPGFVLPLRELFTQSGDTDGGEPGASPPPAAPA